MSWGYKILIVYILFIGMILGMVYVASRQTNEMQDDNYYAKELVYQSVIDGKNNLNALTEKLVVENTSDAVQIKLAGIYSHQYNRRNRIFFASIQRKN
jgi:uncharacterized membrane protein